MLSTTYDTLETKVYAVAADLTWCEVNSEQEARIRRPAPILIVIKSNAGKTKSLFNDDFFAHSQYRLIQPGKNAPGYEERGWKLLSFTEPHDRSRSSVIRIADPTDRQITLDSLKLHSWTGRFFHIEGICNTLRLIRFLSLYSGWQQMEQVNGTYLTALRRVDLSRSWFDQNTLQQNRRLYLWKLGLFLADNNTRMSLGELRKHLIRNRLQVTFVASEFQGEKMDAIVRDVEAWLSGHMNLPDEGIRIARSFVSE